jgi:thioesterase domain-containing protein
MASAHLTSVRALQPHGPYVLGGECVGGVVAYEMAQQLVAAGETVAALILLDTWCPSLAGELHARCVEHPTAVAAALRTIAGRALAEHRRAARRMAGAIRRRAGRGAVLAAARELARATGNVPGQLRGGIGAPYPGQTRRAERAYMRTTHAYRPAPHPGAMTLVVSRHNARLGLVEPWRRLALGGLHVVVVEGDHDTYLHEPGTTDAISACLAQTADGQEEERA